MANMKLTILALVALSIFQFVTSYSIHNDEQLVENAIKEATTQYDDKVKVAAIHGAQSGRRSREMSKSTEYSREVNRISSIYQKALKDLTQRHQMNSTLALSFLTNSLPQQCQRTNVTCDPTSKYRTASGTCNNLKNTLWGSLNTPNSRLLPPQYSADNQPRGGTDGGHLPKPRLLSRVLHQGDGSHFEVSASHMVAQFGQFLDHDLTFTPVESHVCCGNDAAHEDCWPIEVDGSDAHFGRRNITCLNFVRSSSACTPDIEHREQLNGITAFIDGSVIYGSDDAKIKLLRSHRGGQLLENGQHPGFLPWESEVGLEGGSGTTVIAGDVRANEMPGLTVMHSLFLREHNRIAGILQSLTTWSDEKIFQETRRIVAAELQQITYNEFLPAVVGPDAMQTFGLVLPPQGYTTYDSEVDPTIINSFATAAYRFGHTLVNGLIKLMFNDVEVGSYNVKHNYFRSDRVIEKINGVSGYDLILKGLISQNAQAYDGELHSDLANDLFMDVVTQIGTDLVARNIQRGRDHGLPSYNAFRVRTCGLEPLSTWESRPDDFSPSAWNSLRSMYASPGDIDLYTGGLMQNKVKDGLTGRTFACIQAIQFQRLLKGDRFFFTHQNQAGSFTPEQLATLRRRTLGDIICENSIIEETQLNVFYTRNGPNPTMACSDPSRKLDISLFAV